MARLKQKPRLLARAFFDLVSSLSYREVAFCRNYCLIRELPGARNRNRTGTPFLARDFKSLVSTCFTIRAGA